MTRAILTCFHKYTPFGGEFYEPLLDFYLHNMKKYEDEYDMIYLIDSTWEIDPKKIEGMKAKIVRVNPSLRYYDAYKEVLPQVEEDLIMFLDDDMVICNPGIIGTFFKDLTPDTPSWDYDAQLSDGFDVVTIMDTIGTYTTDKLKLGNKFCPYLFASKKDLLMKYLNIDWAPDMPYCETLGHLTEAMVNDDLKVLELKDDKSNILFDGTQDGEYGKGLGYYHIRAGSTPAYLLATKKYGDKETYWSYLKNQPRTEYLRQIAWYRYMIDPMRKPGSYVMDVIDEFLQMLHDIFGEEYDTAGYIKWLDYVKLCRSFHKLP